MSERSTSELRPAPQARVTEFIYHMTEYRQVTVNNFPVNVNTV